MLDLTTGIKVKDGKAFKVYKLTTGKTRYMQITRHCNGKEFTLNQVFEWVPDMDTAIEKANSYMEEMRSNGFLARRFPVYGMEGVYIHKNGECKINCAFS